MYKPILALLISIYSASAIVMPSQSHAKPAAGVSAALSIVPGLGQAANGDVLEGLGWFSAVLGTFMFVKLPNGVGLQMAYSLHSYNIYDAYRDAKPRNHMYSKETVFENYLGTLNPANIIDPIGAPQVGIAAGIGAKNNFRGTFSGTRAARYTFVGFGEEALYRGVLYPGMSDLFSSKVTGAIVSSALFGAAHTQYGVGGRVMVMTLGLFHSWQVTRNKHDLRKSMFSHAWYNFFLPPTGKCETVPIPGIAVRIPF